LGWTERGQGSRDLCSCNRIIETESHRGGEPAWHRRGRRARASARVLVRLGAAAKLLGQHHSAQKAEMGYNVSQGGGGSGPGQSAAPKYPVWGCRCGEAANFAFRTHCRGCGAKGPDKAGRARPASRWDQGPPQLVGTSQGEVAKLRQELAEIKKLLKPPANPAAEAKVQAEQVPKEQSEAADRDKLQKALEQAVGTLGAEDPVSKALKQRLEEAKCSRPPLPRLQAAKRQVDKLEKKLEAVAGDIEAKEQAVARALEEVGQLQAKKQEIEQELRGLRVLQAEAAQQAKQEAEESLLGKAEAAKTTRVCEGQKHKEWIQAVLVGCGDQGAALAGPMQEFFKLADQKMAEAEALAEQAARGLLEAQAASAQMAQPVAQPGAGEAAVDGEGDVAMVLQADEGMLDEKACEGLSDGARALILAQINQGLKRKQQEQKAQGSKPKNLALKQKAAKSG